MRISLPVLLVTAFLTMGLHIYKYPTDHFTSPVSHSIRLSGTFGELRNNHFHAGLDIKSKNKAIGDTIFAIGEGFVSRIQVQEFGYGNVLYLQHPNGFTSVYAHLDEFAPEIQEYVKSKQYEAEQFEVELYPPPFQFSVSQKQFIGIMGNTGYSLGPHLHMEIRHTETQTPVNPLHFGFGVHDQVPPSIFQLITYMYDESGFLQESKIFNPVKETKGKYTLPYPVELGSHRVSFGIKAYDYQDGVENMNGIYSLACHADEEAIFGFALDEISFQHTRYLNAHIDYRQKLYQGAYFHRCHPLEGNLLPIYYTGIDKGMVFLNTEQSRRMKIMVADFHNNCSTIEFDVRRNPDLLLPGVSMPSFQILGLPDQVSILSQKGIQVVWPQGSFYEKTPLSIQILPPDCADAYSQQYELSPTDIPVHYFFDVAIEGLAVPARLLDKAFIARCDADGDVVNCGGRWIGNNLMTSVRQMGTYALLVDTIPPTIRPVSFSSRMAGWKKMTFKIYDNVRARDKARDLLYTARVDEKWILMELDGKSGTLTHQFDGRIPPGDHTLVLKVIDDRGNETILRKTFTL